jgi:hypothetical protein
MGKTIGRSISSHLQALQMCSYSVSLSCLFCSYLFSPALFAEPILKLIDTFEGKMPVNFRLGSANKAGLNKYEQNRHDNETE